MSKVEERDDLDRIEDHSKLSLPQHARVHGLDHHAEVDLKDGHGTVVTLDVDHDSATVFYDQTNDPFRETHRARPFTVKEILAGIHEGSIQVHPHEPLPVNAAGPAATIELTPSPDDDDWLLKLKARFNKF